MESLFPAACFMEELLNFASDIADDEFEDTQISLTSSSSFPLTEFEEELEWISNKDAFPMVESFVDIIPNHPSISTTTTSAATTTANHRSPVSVLESSSGSSTFSHGSTNKRRGSAIVTLPSNFRVPVKARSKQQRKRRRDVLGEQWHSWASQERPRPSGKPSSTIGRKCLHCQAEKTPQWRAGPLGPKTLCNACGVRFKSGRLLPEYRPASSPTFSSDVHSNSHRKIVEMRRQKMMGSVSGSDTKLKMVIG